ncbi:MAG: hypothetical protein VX727_08105 [Planctomycetota bacterium]|nr:hypothetical protein [Planctomycetota bacterium]
MPLLPSSVTASIARSGRTGPLTDRERTRRRATAAETILARADRIDLQIDGVELKEAAERLSGNSDEQSHQERRENQPDGRTPSLTRVDLKA